MMDGYLSCGLDHLKRNKKNNIENAKFGHSDESLDRKLKSPMKSRPHRSGDVTKIGFSLPTRKWSGDWCPDWHPQMKYTYRLFFILHVWIQQSHFPLPHTHQMIDFPNSEKIQFVKKCRCLLKAYIMIHFKRWEFQNYFLNFCDASTNLLLF